MDDRQIAVCSWSLRPGSPEELVEALRRVGLSRVQLALVPLVEAGDTWGNAIAVLRAAGIDIVSGMLAMVGEDYSTLATIAATGGVRPDATWSATKARAERVARLAGSAGIGLVTFHAGFIPREKTDPEWEVIIGRLRAMVDLFADHGVSVAFETGQEEADTLLRALDAIARPGVGVNFDPANMILYGTGEPVGAFRRLAPHVRQVHIKDAVPSRIAGEWGAEVPAGTGAVDWSAFFDVVRGITPPVALVIEREAGPTREADVITARDLVRGLLGATAMRDRRDHVAAVGAGSVHIERGANGANGADLANGHDGTQGGHGGGDPGGEVGGVAPTPADDDRRGA